MKAMALGTFNFTLDQETHFQIEFAAGNVFDRYGEGNIFLNTSTRLMT